jgi:glyoxylase-like metal-dependent hydrolase (beta-lactamase superfamily II)
VTVDDPTADWTAPGVYRAAANVYRIPLPLPQDGLRAVNVYAITAGDELVLIDSGWAIAEAREQLQTALGALGAGLGDVARFLITHAHQDHYTQAVALRREFGSSIAVGKGEQPQLDLINDPADDAKPAFEGRLTTAGASGLLQRLQKFGRRKPDRTVWEYPDSWLSDRDLVEVGDRRLEAIATPGHTRGHVVFLEDATKLLFAGDHVLPHITPSIGFEGAPVDFPLRDYLESLRLVRGMPDTVLLPAHGPTGGSTHARIDALLDHHDRRLAVIAEAVERGGSSAAEVAGMITWTRHERKLDELGLFNEMLAVLETLSHLDVLVLQGRVGMVLDGEVRRYSAV